MKIKTKELYACEICETEYETDLDAKRCEKRPITHDHVKIGTKVLVVNGQGAGELATVKRHTVFGQYWGHYAAERYHHTIGLEVQFRNGLWRTLTFDDYKIQ